MNKNIVLISLLIIGQFALGQNVLDFRPGLLPSVNYVRNNTTTIHCTMAFKASKQYKDAIEKAVGSNPKVMDAETEREFVISCGEMSGDSAFPVTIRVMKSLTGKNEDKTLPQGLKIYGKCMPDSLPVMDSVYAPGVGEEYKKVFLLTIKSVFEQINIPSHKLKVGDDFSQVSTINVPMGVTTIKMDITTIYKLKSMNKNDADFDISMKYKVGVDDDRFTVKGSGNGKGTLIYSVTGRYIKNMDTTNNLNMELTTDGLSIEMKMEGDDLLNTKLSNSPDGGH